MIYAWYREVGIGAQGARNNFQAVDCPTSLQLTYIAVLKP